MERFTAHAPLSADLMAHSSEALLRGLLESAPDAIVIIRGDGRIVLANQQVEALFGYRMEELSGQPVEMLMPARFAHAHVMHRDGYGRNPQKRAMGANLDLFAAHRDGREFPVEISLSPLRVGDDLLVTAVIRDISERLRAQQEQKRLHALQMAEAEHRASLGEVAAGLAHEIKNPLAGIAGALEVLAPAFAGGPEAGIMAEVSAQVARITRTVEDLLNYARPRPLDLHPGDLNKTVEPVVHFAQLAARGAGIDIAFCAGALPVVVHDADQVYRMLLNMLLNAVAASARGQTVTVATGLAAAPGSVFISVEDHGTGIKAEHLPQIFRPFFTTKGSRGSGLGLALCRRIAELHGGAISVRAAPGAGSCFTIVLPRAGAAAGGHNL